MHKRLILFFDGTGQVFHGDQSDTNVVKLYRRMDRQDPDQFLYYQPGIGTYSDNEYTGPFRWASKGREKISKIVDEAFATTFRSHVISGYQFIMKYWNEGDDIYIFGFSRGSYTARFLAQMITDVGLLLPSNDEMVHFAWAAFSDYMRHIEDGDDIRKQKERYMQSFRSTYCRDDCGVHFLGLFDCVSSVTEFELPFGRKRYRAIPTLPAKHIRHAVSIHERRLKFRPALFAPDLTSLHHSDRFGNWAEHHTVKEVWFAGSHVDIGGGSTPLPGQRVLLSDIPLDWMLHEVENHKGDAAEAIHAIGPPRLLSQEQLIKKNVHASDDFVAKGDDIFASRVDPSDFVTRKGANGPEKPIQNHDTLVLGGPRGSGLGMWLLYWLIEVIPVFSRLELENEHWVTRTWPPNYGASRDIPKQDDVTSIHPSVPKLGLSGVFDLRALGRQIMQGRR